MTEPEPRLEEAFRQACYLVCIDETEHAVAIGRPPPPSIVDWLGQRHSARPAWIITGHNPAGQNASDRDNAARQRVLRRCLQQAGGTFLEGVNRDPQGFWPDEPTLWVTGLGEDMIRSLARRFGQAAVVAVRPDRVDLIWIAA